MRSKDCPAQPRARKSATGRPARPGTSSTSGPKRSSATAFLIGRFGRLDLLGVLAEDVRREKRDAVHLGSRCVGFDCSGERVSLLLDDGRQVFRDALVGATACIRKSAGPCSAPRKRNFPVRSPGAASSRCLRCRGTWQAWSARTGLAQGATLSIIRCIVDRARTD